MVKFVVTCWVPQNPVISDVSVPGSSVWGLNQALEGSPEPWVLPGTFWTLGKSLLNEWTFLALASSTVKEGIRPDCIWAFILLPRVFFSDLIVDTEQLRRNGLTACHRRHGCNYEWTFSNGVSIFKKSFVMIIFAYKNNACSLDALSSSMYNLSDVLYAYAHIWYLFLL